MNKKEYIKKLERLFYENLSGGASKEAIALWEEIDARMPKPKPTPVLYDSDGYPVDFNKLDLR